MKQTKKIYIFSFVFLSVIVLGCLKIENSSKNLSLSENAVFIQEKNNFSSQFRQSSKILLNQTIEKITAQNLSVVHVILVSTHNLGKEMNFLRDAGILIEKPTGEGTYVISIPISQIVNLSQQNWTIYIMDYEPSMKIEDLGSKDYYPAYARSSGNLLIIVKFFNDVSKNDAYLISKKYGTIVDDNYDFTHLTLNISEKKISEIAEEDKVLRIEFINGPSSVGVGVN